MPTYRLWLWVRDLVGIDDDNVDRNDILKYNQIQYIDWCIRIDSSYV